MHEIFSSRLFLQLSFIASLSVSVSVIFLYKPCGLFPYVEGPVGDLKGEIK